MVFSKQKYWDKEIKVLRRGAKFGVFKAHVEGQATKFGILKASLGRQLNLVIFIDHEESNSNVKYLHPQYKS